MMFFTVDNWLAPAAFMLIASDAADQSFNPVYQDGVKIPASAPAPVLPPEKMALESMLGQDGLFIQAEYRFLEENVVQPPQVTSDKGIEYLAILFLAEPRLQFGGVRVGVDYVPARPNRLVVANVADQNYEMRKAQFHPNVTPKARARLVKIYRISTKEIAAPSGLIVGQ